MTIFVGTYQLTEEDPPVPVVDASGRFRLYFDGADGGEDVARKAFEANLEKRNITYHSVKPEPIDVDTSVKPPERVNYAELDRLNAELAPAA